MQEILESPLVLNQYEKVIQNCIGSRNREDILVLSINGTARPQNLIGIEIQKFRSFEKASKCAHDILKKEKLNCKQNNQKSIVSGHALMLRENGITYAIVIDIKNRFHRGDLKPGTLFLPKHITEVNN